MNSLGSSLGTPPPAMLGSAIAALQGGGLGPFLVLGAISAGKLVPAVDWDQQGCCLLSLYPVPGSSTPEVADGH